MYALRAIVSTHPRIPTIICPHTAHTFPASRIGAPARAADETEQVGKIHWNGKLKLCLLHLIATSGEAVKCSIDTIVAVHSTSKSENAVSVAVLVPVLRSTSVPCADVLHECRYAHA